MARRSLLLLMLALAQGPTGWAATMRASPTQQVVNMLTEMRDKGRQMMDDEQKVFTTYKKWVKVETSKLGMDIDSGAKEIEELTAFLTKSEVDIAKLGKQITALDADILQHSEEKAKAVEVRKDEYADFITASEDYQESIDALKQAIQVLSAQNFDRAQAEALLQRMSTATPGMPRVLAVLMQQQESVTRQNGEGAPAVAGYESQSTSVVGMLKGLLDKFRSESGEAEKAEMNEAQAYNLLDLHLGNTIASDEADRDEKAVLKGKKKAASARAKGHLAQTKEQKATDEALKMHIESTFESKAVTFKQNQEVRASEIDAIAKAVEILSSPEVADSYSKHLALVTAPQPSGRKTVSLLQLGRSARRSAAARAASALLKERARVLGSKTLMTAAAQVLANPFDKVVVMIENLIAKLKADAEAEAEHKAWCDKELKVNKIKRKKKTAKVSQLQADIEGLEATIVDLGGTIAVLAREQAELAQAMKEATELRQTEKAENAATVKDAKAGFEAVGRAMAIIKDFYAKQGGASLLQQVPEMASYKGQQRRQGGVVAMLEVVLSDFARLRTDTESAETAAAAQYKSFMAESEGSQKDKHDREFKLNLEKDQAEYETSEAQKDLAATQEELDKANEYFNTLKPSCVEVRINWEDRVQQRKEEVAALKQAYGILDNKYPSL